MLGCAGIIFFKSIKELRSFYNIKVCRNPLKFQTEIYYNRSKTSKSRSDQFETRKTVYDLGRRYTGLGGLLFKIIDSQCLPQPLILPNLMKQGTVITSVLYVPSHF